jgi:hypothetical protein
MEHPGNKPTSSDVRLQEDVMPGRDYTRLPIGTKIDDGEIQECPYCGRAGMVMVVGGKTYYNHKQLVGMDREDTLITQFEFCPQAKKAA